MSNRIVDTTWDDLLSAGIVGIIVWLFWKAIIVALFIGILLLSKVSLPSTEAVFKGIGALIATGYLVYILYLIEKQDKKQLKKNGKVWLWIIIWIIISIFAIWAISKATYLILALN